jgi:hypothetical protein
MQETMISTGVFSTWHSIGGFDVISVATGVHGIADIEKTMAEAKSRLDCDASGLVLDVRGASSVRSDLLNLYIQLKEVCTQTGQTMALYVTSQQKSELEERLESPAEWLLFTTPQQIISYSVEHHFGTLDLTTQESDFEQQEQEFANEDSEDFFAGIEELSKDESFPQETKESEVDSSKAQVPPAKNTTPIFDHATPSGFSNLDQKDENVEEEIVPVNFELAGEVQMRGADPEAVLCDREPLSASSMPLKRRFLLILMWLGFMASFPVAYMLGHYFGIL